MAQGDFSHIRRRTVGYYLAFFDGFAAIHYRPLIYAGSLIGTLELEKLICILALAVLSFDDYASGIDICYRSCIFSQDYNSGVSGGGILDARRHYRTVRNQQGHRLALHVGTHKCAVGVVVFKEGDHRRSYRDHLPGRNIHAINDFAIVEVDFAEEASGKNLLVYEAPVLIERLVRLSDDERLLFVRCKI